MKRLVIVVIVLAILGGIALTRIETEVVDYQAPVEETVEVVPQDLIQKAQEELERINQELDAEEQKLLQEIEERKTRIENIHKTRASFQ